MNPQRQIPSASPTKGSALPESSGFSLMAAMAAAPIWPTAIPPPRQAIPTARAAAMYLITASGRNGSSRRGRLREQHRHGGNEQQRQGHERTLLHLEPPDERRMNGENSSPVSLKNLEKNS